MPYTEVTISSYNATPPTDDGASGAANTITWAKIKEKLGDPIKTGLESVDDNVAAACSTLDSSITSAESSITTISGNITSETGVLSAPDATELFFVQTAAPTGWTKITTHNDKAIRLISGTVSTGGSTAFTSVFTSRSITSSIMPSHSHTVAVTNQAVTLNSTTWSVSVSFSEDGYDNTANQRNAYTGGSYSTTALAATVSHSGTTGSTGSGTAMDFDVQYVDIILASKD